MFNAGYLVSSCGTQWINFIHFSHVETMVFQGFFPWLVGKIMGKIMGKSWGNHKLQALAVGAPGRRSVDAWQLFLTGRNRCI